MGLLPDATKCPFESETNQDNPDRHRIEISCLIIHSSQPLMKKRERKLNERDAQKILDCNSHNRTKYIFDVLSVKSSFLELLIHNSLN